MAIEFGHSIPTLRIFSEEKAREFYLDFLGFEVTFEHRYGDDFPLFMGIRRGACHLHLSEHHGDACPGSAISIEVQGCKEYQESLLAKDYAYCKPGGEENDWHAWETTVRDPFGNKLTFFENK